MVAGPNGSGKSTLIDALRADPRFELPALYVNADDLQKERGITDPLAAQRLASELRIEAIAAGADVMYETVMSHPSRIAELQQAKGAGYHVTVLFIATEDPDVNVQRVAARVAAGGHDVPADRTRSRFGRTLALAPLAIGYADQAFVFDNSRMGDTGGGLSQQAMLVGGRLVLLGSTSAAWVRLLAGQVDERADELQSLARSIAAGGLPPALAQLDDAQTTGPVVGVGKHYVLQYDRRTTSMVLHDWLLLGEPGKALAVGQVLEIRYADGVAAVAASE